MATVRGKIHRKPGPMTVAGMMSGTSGDGIDIALVRMEPGKQIKLKLLAHRSFPFPKALRAAVLGAQDARRTTTAELARLHWRLGLAYAQAFTKMRDMHPEPIDLVGCHGQTIYHQAIPALYAGERFACTWQIGEMAPLARAAGVPVVLNFRPADMVAGGGGAPLVPLFDEVLYRDRKRTRVLQNIGGIGNLTAVPPLGSAKALIAFDTGPGNIIIDALMQQLFSKPYDRGGRVAARGNALMPVVEHMLLQPFFAQRPPRSAGREQFGEAFTGTLLRACRKLKGSPEDAVATATALTAHSIARAVQKFVAPALFGAGVDFIVSGGGAKNTTLVAMLGNLLSENNTRVMACDDPSLPTPMPVEAKEAAAFALLAYRSWHKQPGNVPLATGAREAVVLGQVSCG